MSKRIVLLVAVVMLFAVTGTVNAIGRIAEPSGQPAIGPIAEPGGQLTAIGPHADPGGG